MRRLEATVRDVCLRYDSASRRLRLVIEADTDAGVIEIDTLLASSHAPKTFLLLFKIVEPVTDDEPVSLLSLVGKRFIAVLDDDFPLLLDVEPMDGQTEGPAPGTDDA